MLADDQKLFAESVVALLSQNWPNALIETATDYSALFRDLKAHAPFDFIIVDLRMSEDDAEPYLQKARCMAPGAVLILISGSPDAFEIGKALSTGVDAFVHKNQGADDLVDTIRRFLGERIMERATVKEPISKEIVGIALSRRERQTLNLIAAGLETKEIAQALKIAPTTVKIYIKSLLKKTGCSNRTALAVLAINSGFVNRSDA
ncbi:response regulator transcription factor [Hyphomonas sp.]|uniref:response regulator transcription factor n=1 Tax=Hyphomonas sp. TaxID=87 RepID=UPI0025C28262|nr:response regulator transcription factor [Hyphomonas sp.]